MEEPQKKTHKKLSPSLYAFYIFQDFDSPETSLNTL